MRLRPILVLTLAAALTSPALTSPATAGDIIVLRSGRMVGNSKASDPPTLGDYVDSSFRIQEERLDNIVYKIDGVPTPQTIKYADVETIYHDPSDIPSDLTRGNRARDNRQYEEALGLYEDAAKDSTIPKWAQVEGALRVAEVLYDLGDLDGSAKAFDSFLAKNKASRWVPHATEHAARIKLDKGDVAGARALFLALKDMKGLPDAERLDIEYWIVWIDEQVASSKNDSAGLEKALKGYDGLLSQIRGKKGLDELRGKCTVGKASCLLGTGQYADAEQLTQKIIDSSKDDLSRAGAYTMLGRAIVLQNTGKNDPVKYKQALLHFLRVITLYGNESGAETYMAESLFRAGELFNELKPANATSDEDKEAAKMARLRARREWQECIQRFPRSSWATKARASMAN